MTKIRRGLGKGLEALIPQDEIFQIARDDLNDENILEIDINSIIPNRNQPRKNFDKDKLVALENSIKEHGIIQPILLRKTEDGYEIVAGERRWRAAKNLKMKSMPAVIKNLSDRDVSEIALIENLQRENLNDIEEAVAYKTLIEEYSLTQERLSVLVGKSRSHIANTMRLLKLDDETINSIVNSEISGGHGRALISIEDISQRHDIIDNIIARNLSVREVENMVSKINKNTTPKKLNLKTHDLVEIEEKLCEFLGTKASIKIGKSKSKIEIEYYNDGDLNRILEILKLQ